MTIISTNISKAKFSWLVLALLFVSQTRAQTSTDSIPSDLDVVSVDTSLVTVNVSVMDHKNRHVPSLQLQDFQLTDEGKVVTPAFFDHQGPVSIVFVVDLSSSMKGNKWKNLRTGMKHFLMNSREGSDYTLIAFNERPRLVIADTNAEQLWKSFDSLTPNGETALYDAMLLGLEMLDRTSQRHKALVLLSDGEDNCSQAGLAVVEQQVLAHRATIFPVGIMIDGRLAPYQPNGRKLLD